MACREGDGKLMCNQRASTGNLTWCFVFSSLDVKWVFLFSGFPVNETVTKKAPKLLDAPNLVGQKSGLHKLMYSKLTWGKMSS